MTGSTSSPPPDRFGLSAAGGAILAALAASACCVGPLLLALVGLGGASLLGRIASLRPYLMALTVVLLGTGFLLAYRRRAPAAASPDCACERPRITLSGRVALWFATVAAAGLFVAPYVVAAWAGHSRSGPVETAGMATTTLVVPSMSCASCAPAISNALAKVEGVRQVSIHLERRTVTVGYVPGRASPEALISAVKRAGYDAQRAVSPDPGRAPGGSPARPAAFETLGADLDALRRDFNAAAGKVRVVMLVAPS